MFSLIKPFIGFLGTDANAYYAYGGFGIDGYYGKKKNIVMTPSVACGFYKDGSEIKAGNPLEFYKVYKNTDPIKKKIDQRIVIKF